MGVFPVRRRYVIAVLLVAGAIAAVSLSRRDDIPGPDRFWFMGPLSPFGASASSSQKPVALELRNSQQKITKLSIPRAYISTISEPDKTQQSFINFVVYLPDYLPKVLADKAGHQTLGKAVNGFRLRSPDEILVTLKPTIPGAIQRGVEWEKSRTKFGGSYRDRFEIYYEGYHNTGKNSGYLFPVGRDDVSIRFVSNPKTEQMTGCTIRYSLTEALSVEISIHAAQIDQYERIMKSVSELVNRFLIEANTKT